MKLRLPRSAIVALTVVSVTAGATAGAGADSSAPPAGHVLLISVDGLHASDVTKCIAAHLCPTIEKLTAQGTTYSNASSSLPSDSSPGIVALTTGGSPKLTGVYYDDTYNRTLLPAGTKTCTAATPGTEVPWTEGIDRSQNPIALDAGAPSLREPPCAR